MTEEQKRKQMAQVREFPETMELLTKVRDRLAEALFQTTLADKELREDLFVKVQALDALKTEMSDILRSADSDKQIEDYLKSIAAKQIPATRQ